MRSLLFCLVAFVSLPGRLDAADAAQAYEGPVRAYVAKYVQPWLSDPGIVKAVERRNAENSALGPRDIFELDRQWDSALHGGNSMLVDGILGNATSRFLREKQALSSGIISEIFIMDSKGLVVGESDITSDYWQGDEDKFQKSYGAGPKGYFIGPAEKDESTQTVQAQASLTIVDSSGRPVGAVTVGINLDAL